MLLPPVLDSDGEKAADDGYCNEPFGDRSDECFASHVGARIGTGTAQLSDACRQDLLAASFSGMIWDITVEADGTPLLNVIRLAYALIAICFLLLLA
jgi:hypothetical protein